MAERGISTREQTKKNKKEDEHKNYVRVKGHYYLQLSQRTGYMWKIKNGEEKIR